MFGFARRLMGRVAMVVAVGLVVVLGCGVVCGGAVAAGVPATAWRVVTAGVPTVMPSGVGHRGKYSATVENIGVRASEGEITLKEDLPAGLNVTSVEPEGTEEAECPTVSSAEVVCGFRGSVVSSGFIVVNIEFEVVGVVGSSLRDVVEVSGGNGRAASGEVVTRVGGEHESAPAGFARFDMEATGPAGEPFTQAGGHPTYLTTTLLLNNISDEEVQEKVKPVEAAKDLVFYLPVGMLGNPAVADPCPASLVELHGGLSGCPPSSRVGTVLPMVVNQVFAHSADPTREQGIFSVTPERGYAAEFAFGTSNGIVIFIYATVVRHDGAYVLRVATPGVPGLSSLIGLIASFYGDVKETYTTAGSEFTTDRGAFLTDPSDCEGGPLERESLAEMDTWKEPGVMLSAPSDTFAALEGCGLLGFSATLGVRPQTTQAEAPAGYEVGFAFPQAPNGGSGLGTPPLKDASVTLPAGTTISPSSANGLLACGESGPAGFDVEGGESEVVGADGLEHAAAGHCPAGSEIGSVSASTPLLREGLTGHLMLAEPFCGGAGQPGCTPGDAEDGALYRLYMELEAPHAGVIVKLQGAAHVNAVTGQITAVFDENPQFPLSALAVTTNSGPRAPLSNPQACGAASTQAQLTSWAEPEPVPPEEARVRPSSVFTVDWDGAGGACPAGLPFAPSFTAGTSSPLAGATSPFTLTLKREDREQNISSLSSTLPEGLLAYLSHVGRCPEPLASEVSLTACPASSQIGTTSVGVGSGSDPYYVTGKVFLTGPYKGAPFGLSVVVPAVAGPFNLGDVLVRVALQVDRHTAQVTAVSDPLPQIIDGVPLRIRTLSVSLDAREFMLNPTSCAPLSATGVVYSTTGASRSVSSPFAAAGCKSLPFKLGLSASTQKRSTKADGTSVRVKLAYPSGGEANAAKVVIGFPKQLPVRLSTLQQACRAVVFEANPAGCPSASSIGTATAHTPILSQPLSGPVYLVSFGNAKFPDVVFVLQGEGVTLDVIGQSFISHAGALKVTFSSIPDAPFTTFETVLPSGPFSQFTSYKSTTHAVSSQCGENLTAPVRMVGHNGAEVSETAQIAVTGCGPQVSLVKTKATVAGVTVTVQSSVRGRLSISAAGLKTLTRKGLAAGVHKLTLAFTSAGRRAARAHQRTELTVGLVVGKQKVSRHQKVVL